MTAGVSSVIMTSKEDIFPVDDVEIIMITPMVLTISIPSTILMKWWSIIIRGIF